MSVLTFLGLALADAMNPFSIAAMAFLLTTDRPLARGIVFVLGTLIVYVPFGVALVEGWTALLTSLLPLIPWWVKGGLLVAGALLCVGIAWRMIRSDDPQDLASSVSNRLSLPATATFAIASTLMDAPTALPFFAAAAQILTFADGRVGQYLWVVFYCLIYVTPLLLLIGLRVGLGDRSGGALQAVKTAVAWSFANLMPPALILIGLWLAWIGTAMLLEGI